MYDVGKSRISKGEKKIELKTEAIDNRITANELPIPLAKWE